MQFIEYGPTIPNELIHACSAGDVVFFCGAGVSQMVGVDGFKTLTEKLIDALDPAPGARIREWISFYHDADRFPADMPVPYADLYQELQDEFGAEQVECEMARIIQMTTDPNPDSLDPHTTLLELSRNASGEHPQLITTNIDILFERLGIVTDIHVAPRLPRVHRRNPFTGIAYLHGRLQNTDAGRYIFSSSDFGRAYLSEGWATLFLKELLDSGKSIVFIGYSAGDSTIKILLQALHAAGEDYPLYAFEKGAKEEVERNWNNKDVNPVLEGSSQTASGKWLA